MFFFGDYLQYRSVYDAPLHTDFSLPSRKKSSKLPTEKEIQQRVARSLILQINCVIKLTQQVRTDDLQYLQLLAQFRRGECDSSDYELLQTRVVGQTMIGSLRQPPWNKVSFSCFSKNDLIIFSLRLPFWYFGMRCEPNSTTKQRFTKRSNSDAHRWYVSLKTLAKGGLLKILYSSEKCYNCPLARRSICPVYYLLFLECLLF